jgi:hypothetical protein
MSYTNPLHPYVIPPYTHKTYYPPVSTVSYPYPYGNFCRNRFLPYNYPFTAQDGFGRTYGYDAGYEYKNNTYNNYRTPYYPFGPFKVGPYY